MQYFVYTGTKVRTNDWHTNTFKCILFVHLCFNVTIKSLSYLHAAEDILQVENGGQMIGAQIHIKKTVTLGAHIGMLIVMIRSLHDWPANGPSRVIEETGDPFPAQARPQTQLWLDDTLVQQWRAFGSPQFLILLSRILHWVWVPRKFICR